MVMKIEPQALTAEERAAWAQAANRMAEYGHYTMMVRSYAALLHAEAERDALRVRLEVAERLIESCADHFTTRDHRNDDEINHGSRCVWADEARAYMEAHG